jgi:16S rRNA (guanine(966)-N(2))-methyltransferase RsmD
MRIIAGQFRSRVLLGPEDEQTTRPITDRVKQSLFDMVGPMAEGRHVYDCFAGTGSMGLESLSRGASRATFF